MSLSPKAFKAKLQQARAEVEQLAEKAQKASQAHKEAMAKIKELKKSYRESKHVLYAEWAQGIAKDLEDIDFASRKDLLAFLREGIRLTKLTRTTSDAEAEKDASAASIVKEDVPAEKVEESTAVESDQKKDLPSATSSNEENSSAQDEEQILDNPSTAEEKSMPMQNDVLLANNEEKISPTQEAERPSEKPKDVDAPASSAKPIKEQNAKATVNKDTPPNSAPNSTEPPKKKSLLDIALEEEYAEKARWSEGKVDSGASSQEDET